VVKEEKQMTLKVEDIRKAKTPGRMADGRGLFLNVAAGGSKSWIQRIRIDGRRLDKGLGGFPAVTLTHARRIADSNRVVVAAGGNPWASKEHTASATAKTGTSQRRTLTFREVARLVHAEYSRDLDSEKNARNWIQTLERHIFPAIGNVPINEVGRADVLAALKPIWWTLPDAARRLRSRVRRVLDWAVESDLLTINPERSITKVSLPPQPKVLTHRPALGHRSVAAALDAVRESEAWDATKLCFEWMVLTASRPQEARCAQWGEIQGGLWVITAGKMKARKAHSVPLSEQAKNVLRRARELYRAKGDDSDWPTEVHGTDYIFPHPTTRQPLSVATLNDRAKKCNLPCVSHGFRSSFRDWAEEESGATNHAIELSLAHAIGNAVERAYLRTDLLEQRRELMAAWANYVSPQDEPPF
jgi:integrase